MASLRHQENVKSHLADRTCHARRSCREVSSLFAEPLTLTQRLRNKVQQIVRIVTDGYDTVTIPSMSIPATTPYRAESVQ